MLALLLASATWAAEPSIPSVPVSEATIAVERLDRACAGGDARACDDVARRYHLGEHGAPRDGALAAARYEAACRLGVAADCAYAAWYAVTERPDAEHAIAVATIGCDAGDVGSCAVLGHMQLLGVGIERDDAQGLARLRAGCDAAWSAACLDLGLALGGAVPGVTVDEAAATPLLARSCETDHEPTACSALGMLALRGAAPGFDAARGRALVRQACEAGDPNGCEHLGAALALGLGGSADAVAAIGPLDKACDAGRALACSQLAAMALGGQGRPADRGVAIGYARRACVAGDTNACAQLDAACARGASDTCR